MTPARPELTIEQRAALYTLENAFGHLIVRPGPCDAEIAFLEDLRRYVEGGDVGGVSSNPEPEPHRHGRGIALHPHDCTCSICFGGKCGAFTPEIGGDS